jgi:hypothetical protein
MSAVDREDLRLNILMILVAERAFTANQATLARRLAGIGINVMRDALLMECIWLDEVAGAVVDKDVDGVHILTLTDDGAEHLTGARGMPKIRKPTPGEIAKCLPFLK